MTIRFPNKTDPNPEMRIRDSIRPSWKLAAVFICTAIPQLVAQTPSPAAKFNDSVSIFRQSATSDWPALFVSPLPYDSEAETLNGLAISVDESWWGTAATFSMSPDGATFYMDSSGWFQWLAGTSGVSMMLSGDGQLYISGYNGNQIEIAATDGFIRIGDYAVLTEGNVSQLLGSTTFLPVTPSRFNFSASVASGEYSFAVGSGVFADGLNSAGFGLGTTAKGYNQLVIGEYNALQGTGTANANAGDALFIIGNGTSTTNRSSALTVNRNAATGIGTGIVTTTASQTIVGKYNDTSNDSEGRSRGAGLFVVGMGTGNPADPAAVQRKNALRVREDGTLLVRPAGDISMGDFQTGEQP